ncbi:dexamethasone-induced Ras-related protein 1-like [Haliotis cracherodii]|uniref:dexamethasone-induced Ras-related protein 1-like n=1 Tax=Haliotis cracherodii TaxID=6455 RepID=UPI0039ED2E84
MFHFKSRRAEGEEHCLRVAVMGSAACGKTSIINQYLQQIFLNRYVVKVGEIHNTSLEVAGETIDLDIWDTSGVYCFDAARRKALQICDAFLLVYAMNDIVSFEKAIALQKDIIETRGPVTIVFAGTKADLKSSQWLEQQHHFSDFVREETCCTLHEVSAKTGSGISEVIVDIAKQWRKGQKKPKELKVAKWLKRNVLCQNI